ncbi:putative octanoyltransferase [Paramyrothecium foliicola]|nr:putative octanoyltransferase [Paramyrothecium foliicola]
MWRPIGQRHLGNSRCPLPSSRVRADLSGSPPRIGLCSGRSIHSRGAGTLGGLRLVDHHHLSGDGPGGIVAYDAAEAAQEDHRSKILAYKSLDEQARSGVPLPRPRLISFESTPTFTLGRRQVDPTLDQAARLERDLMVSLPRRRQPIHGTALHPTVKKTSRGGLTTYHGPGQLVLWPVLDMHSPLHARFGVASYACLLEKTTQRLLAELFGLETYTNRDEPGVWVTAARSGQPRKIAAMGVHHRRYVTALGIALNVDVPVTGGEEVNPWARFVPCGLEGKLVTSVAAEAGARTVGDWDIPELAASWASMFEEGLVGGISSCSY